jgi:Putative lipoprotein LpqV
MPMLPRANAMCSAILTVALTSCSPDEQAVPTTPAPKADRPEIQTSELPPPDPLSPLPPEAHTMSAAGVTTRVEAPAEATESQYGQACHAAKVWMDERGGDPATLVEPYLKLVQDTAFTGPGNFNATWTQLTPGQQAGVIMAANAAAQGQCA